MKYRILKKIHLWDATTGGGNIFNPKTIVNIESEVGKFTIDEQYFSGDKKEKYYKYIVTQHPTVPIPSYYPIPKSLPFNQYFKKV